MAFVVFVVGTGGPGGVVALRDQALLSAHQIDHDAYVIAVLSSVVGRAQVQRGGNGLLPDQREKLALKSSIGLAVGPLRERSSAA